MFYDVYLSLCKQRKESPSKVAENVGLNRSAVVKWKRGTIPNGPTIQKLAEYLNVTTDTLLGTETEKAPVPKDERKPDIDVAKIALFGGDGEVTDEMWEEAIFAAQMIKERYRRKKSDE